MKRKSLSERLPERIFNRIHQDIGQASMCWIPRPAGNYQSKEAGAIAFELCHFIADEIDKAKEQANG